MNRFKTIIYLTLVLTIISCQSDDDNLDSVNVINTVKLSDMIVNRTVETGAVIACAASDATNADVVHAFYYLEEGATNVRFFETNTTDIDKDDYSSYRELAITSQPLFDGYIYKFTRPFAHEQWIIIAFELDGEIKLSNPIRTKNVTKPTVWGNKLMINQQTSNMPVFSWEHNANGDNAIYFQVVSTTDNGLLSGTYTYENQFQYYDTSNVVLNITEENPLELTIDNSYKFTLMDVSEDNWVNAVIQSIFMVE
ncbi:hypothetical protein [Kordia sp.]|uniref:hypothetical protein n=1 Tax=Kordia sp. TaxID=1965332 RepID=UPI0025C661A8|nr:hypothetical protein [Kordia sp.]MCH2196293.1 hypothetical protein [Kordia sp.]